MNCPHRGVSWDGTCVDCGRRLAPPPAAMIAASIARCLHPLSIRQAIERDPSQPRWCPLCGAAYGPHSRVWVPCIFADHAKALDAAGGLAGVLAVGQEVDSGEKNVN